jgi:hypothetical protein
LKNGFIAYKAFEAAGGLQSGTAKLPVSGSQDSELAGAQLPSHAGCPTLGLNIRIERLI